MGNKCCCCPWFKNSEQSQGSSTGKGTSVSHRKVKIESNNLSEGNKGGTEQFNPFKKKPPHVLRDNYKLLLSKEKKEDDSFKSLATTSLLHINSTIMKTNQ